MADSTIHMSVRVRDMDRTRLFVYQLEELISEMRISGGIAGPMADYRARLESLFKRYIDGGDDEGDGEFADEVTVEETVETPCPRCGWNGDPE